MNQVELLLRLSENSQDRGDEIARRQREERMAHTKELSDLYRLIELARQNVEGEMRRFGMDQPQAIQSSPPAPSLPPAPSFLTPKGGNSATQKDAPRAASPR